LYKAQQNCAPAEKKECNKYGSDCSSVFSDWSIIMIRPGGLLLVVSLPFRSPTFNFMDDGVENKKEKEKK
jgi:hypothetical protein